MMAARTRLLPPTTTPTNANISNGTQEVDFTLQEIDDSLILLRDRHYNSFNQASIYVVKGLHRL
jgi:hypothetical protein